MDKPFMVVVFITLFLLSTPVVSSPITYDLRDSSIEGLDDDDTFSVTIDGLTASFMTSDGVFNRTSSGFGVNASGGGDDTDAIDAGAGFTESVMISFSEDITLLGITVSNFGSDDSGLLDIASLFQFEINITGLFDLNNILLLKGNLLSLTHHTGNGFSFDSIAVSKVTVPEPGTMFLMFLGLCMYTLIMFRKEGVAS